MIETGTELTLLIVVWFVPFMAAVGSGGMIVMALAMIVAAILRAMEGRDG